MKPAVQYTKSLSASAGILGLLLFSAVLHAQEQRGSTALMCKKAEFNGSLEGGRSFSRDLGRGLLFKLVPIGQKWGWEIQVQPRSSESDDYAYPLNPPLRFGNSQYLGTGYGQTAREQFSHQHDVRFILNASEYERIFKLTTDALWPYQASNPEQAGERYLNAIEHAGAGLIRVTVKHFDTDAEGKVVKSIRYAISVIVPSDFELASDLRSSNTECPTQVHREPSGTNRQ